MVSAYTDAGSKAGIGAAIAVARSSQTKVSAFSDLVQGLMNAGVAVVGSVLNEVPRKKVRK